MKQQFELWFCWTLPQQPPWGRWPLQWCFSQRNSIFWVLQIGVYWFYLLLKLVLMWEILNVTCDDRALTVVWTFGLGCLFESSITKDNRSTKGIQGNLTVFLEIDPITSQCKNFYWGHQPKLSKPITGNEFHLNSLPSLLPNCQGTWNYLEGKPEAGFLF